MGVAKSWRYTSGVLVLAHKNLKVSEHNHYCLLWSPAASAAAVGGQRRRRISMSVVCGVLLFVLGLVSFFTGHVASDLEWCSHKIVRPRLRKKKLDRISAVPVDIWKSKYSSFYYGCSERSPYYAPPAREVLSNGYLLIAASGGLNQQRTGVLQLTKFDYRLASDLDEELQRLRCRVNYHALRFTKPIQNIGQKLVMEMRKMASRFIAIHLRFEPDMLAFSGCYYGGGDKERNELGEIRKRWATLPVTSPDGERKRGKCPLTPHEVGLMLRALGFENNTYLYVASGEIYGGEETLKPLRELFPNFYTKEMLASKELEPFLSYSSQLAAIDYIVCDESDVFVTNNNGNMAKILAGRRRYMGHKRTIRPNAKKLNALFFKRDKIPWETFAKKLNAAQKGYLGEPDDLKTGRGDFHEYPSTCICKKPFKNQTFATSFATRNPEEETEYGRNEEDQGVHNVGVIGDLESLSPI